MPDDFAKRSDINGQGKRIDTLREEFVECRAAKEQQLASLNTTVTKIEGSVTQIYDLQRENAENIGSLKSSIKGLLSQIGLIVGLIMVFVQGLAILFNFLKG